MLGCSHPPPPTFSTADTVLHRVLETGFYPGDGGLLVQTRLLLGFHAPLSPQLPAAVHRRTTVCVYMHICVTKNVGPSSSQGSLHPPPPPSGSEQNPVRSAFWFRKCLELLFSSVLRTGPLTAFLSYLIQVHRGRGSGSDASRTLFWVWGFFFGGGGRVSPHFLGFKNNFFHHKNTLGLEVGGGVSHNSFSPHPLRTQRCPRRCPLTKALWGFGVSCCL